jgi:hypothetical protein
VVFVHFHRPGMPGTTLTAQGPARPPGRHPGRRRYRRTPGPRSLHPARLAGAGGRATRFCVRTAALRSTGIDCVGIRRAGRAATDIAPAGLALTSARWSCLSVTEIPTTSFRAAAVHRAAFRRTGCATTAFSPIRISPIGIRCAGLPSTRLAAAGLCWRCLRHTDIARAPLNGAARKSIGIDIAVGKPTCLPTTRLGSSDILHAALCYATFRPTAFHATAIDRA